MNFVEVFEVLSSCPSSLDVSYLSSCHVHGPIEVSKALKLDLICDVCHFHQLIVPLACHPDFFDLPWPVLHVVLAAKDDRHVDAAVVEHVRPVLHHPDARVLVDELILEVENVRIVGRYFHIHLEAALQTGRPGYTHTHTHGTHLHRHSHCNNTRFFPFCRQGAICAAFKSTRTHFHTSTHTHRHLSINIILARSRAPNAYVCGEGYKR